MFKKVQKQKVIINKKKINNKYKRKLRRLIMYPLISILQNWTGKTLFKNLKMKIFYRYKNNLNKHKNQ